MTSDDIIPAPPCAADIDALVAFVEARLDDLRGNCLRLDTPVSGVERRREHVRSLARRAQEALRYSGYPLLYWNLLVDEAATWDGHPGHRADWCHRPLCETGTRALLILSG
ncbi:hypothetical protein ACIQGZ_26710 [Streptomyces sp. NPDC092296]|uniref:hypothetical protein n=1 Tax=Streptomyces sp. NPDC092296 TaxID=3366012 RepID=UPI0037FCFEC7